MKKFRIKSRRKGIRTFYDAQVRLSFLWLFPMWINIRAYECRSDITYTLGSDCQTIEDAEEHIKNYKALKGIKS